MPDTVDAAVHERLRQDFLELRDAALKALFAYKAIGMGAGGWTSKDRIAFDELTRTLSRPVPRAADDIRPDDDPAPSADMVCRLMAACRSGEGFRLSRATWDAIVTEADLAVPAYRQYVAVHGTSADLEDVPSATGVAHAVIEQEVLRGFPVDDDLFLRAEEAIAAASREDAPAPAGP